VLRNTFRKPRGKSLFVARISTAKALIVNRVL
jgi:hypothetical protein